MMLARSRLIPLPRSVPPPFARAPWQPSCTSQFIRTIADSKGQQQQQQQQQQPHVGTSPWSKGKLLMTTIGAGTFVSLLYYLYKKHQLREHPIRMFEEGKMQCLKPSVETDHTSDKQKVKEPMIPRDEEQARFASILNKARRGYYVVVTGEHGTGKSTLVEDFCRSHHRGPHSPSGCVLVLIPEKHESLGTALGRMFCAAPGLVYALPPTAAEMKMNSLLTVIEEAALKYRERHGSHPMLIVDNIDYVTDIEEVYSLQNQAKTWADEDVLTVVFVTSDGRVAQALAARSAWSRATEYQIGGIPEPAAIDYLVKHGFAKDNAQQVVRELTGDRLSLLREVSDKRDLNFEGLCTSVFGGLRKHFDSLWTNDERGTLSIAEAILKSPTKSISLNQFNTILKRQDPEAFRARKELLLRNQVFALTGDKVMFQSRAMQAYAECQLQSVQPTSQANSERATTSWNVFRWFK